MSGAGGAGAGASGGEAGAWTVRMSESASRTFNPIRQTLANIKFPPKDVELLKLSIGDPTVFGNLPPCSVLTKAAEAAVRSEKHNGYCNSTGTDPVRSAVAKRYNTEEYPVAKEDIVLASGASQALQYVIEALVNPGDNIIMPQPLFPLYTTIVAQLGGESRFYNLDPDAAWQCRLDEMEAQINDRTRAIIVNNPSNPCGSVYGKEHLSDILALAERKKVVVIADEIYRNMAFSGHTFYSLGQLNKNVPVLSVGGLAKEFVVPGWRVGWIIVHDYVNALGEIREALFNLSTVTMGTSTLLQSVVPTVLDPSPEDKVELEGHLNKIVSTLEENALFCASEVETIPGLSVNRPQGAMYIMVRIEDGKFPTFKDDYDFAQALLLEEGVFVLPGKCFRMSGFFRVVVCAPKTVLEASFAKIRAFCARHHVATPITPAADATA